MISPIHIVFPIHVGAAYVISNLINHRNVTASCLLIVLCDTVSLIQLVQVNVVTFYSWIDPRLKTLIRVR